MDFLDWAKVQTYPKDPVYFIDAPKFAQAAWLAAIGEGVRVERERCAKVAKDFGDAAMLARFVCHDSAERRKLEQNAAVADMIEKAILESLPASDAKD